MDGSMTVILDPTGLERSGGLNLAPRPEDLRGKTVGILDNGRWVTWGMVAEHFTDKLKEHYGVADVIYLNQERVGLEQGIGRDESLADLASKVDVAIVGLGN
ncbi:MAG: hypothetical protein Q7O66_00740 [Dehalococcoidia bacterium]|nr:hypothetical protein [Dehalococcoidia bacterium]